MTKTARWDIKETDANLELMAKTLGIGEITARVMANRGIRSRNTALAYLNANLSSLRDPFLICGMEAAVRLLVEAASRREKITIYGDYDADGVMGTVILYKTLSRYGAEVDYYIPNRTEEGYGLNMNSIRRMKDSGCEWILTVDNGISALEEVEEAKRLGMRVIIIDHHEPGFVESGGARADVIPAAEAVVDPKQNACTYPFKQLCGAGLAYKLACAFYGYTGLYFADHDELLALAAVATVCDIVELRDENRVIVKNGLDLLNANKLINPGLGSLITRRGYLDKPIDTFTAGFILGPCINATGRLESADISVKLLLASADDITYRAELAEKLASLNEERKALTAEGVDRAFKALSQTEPDKVLVFADAETHESVAGIVAGRVKDVFNRPAIILTRGDTPDGFKGSGRSIEGYNMFEALYKYRNLFLRFGGHAMAAGLTLPEENIPLLRENLNRDCALTGEDFRPMWALDGLLKPEGIDLALSGELSRLAPFGKGNPEPLFASEGLIPETLRVIDEKSTIIFTFLCENGKRLKGICFGLNEKFAEELTAFDERRRMTIRAGAPKQAGLVMDAVYGVETNLYNGVKSVQLRIRDFTLKI